MIHGRLLHEDFDEDLVELGTMGRHWPSGRIFVP
jgi:hypothetical protein